MQHISQGTKQTDRPDGRVAKSTNNSEIETTSERARRVRAASILESVENLFWHAQARCESVPQTRLYFERVVAGIEPASPADEYKDAVYGDKLPAKRIKEEPDERKASSPRHKPAMRKIHQDMGSTSSTGALGSNETVLAGGTTLSPARSSPKATRSVSRRDESRSSSEGSGADARSSAQRSGRRAARRRRRVLSPD